MTTDRKICIAARFADVEAVYPPEVHIQLMVLSLQLRVRASESGSVAIFSQSEWRMLYQAVAVCKRRKLSGVQKKRGSLHARLPTGLQEKALLSTSGEQEGMRMMDSKQSSLQSVRCHSCFIGLRDKEVQREVPSKRERRASPRTRG